jgi:hypothetical protein
MRAEVRNTHQLLVNHINRMREITCIGGTMAVMVLEANLGFESQHILHALQDSRIQRWMALSEGAGGGLGLLTTAGRKEEYALLLREAMRVGKICFNEQFFSLSMGVVEAKKRLRDEMLNFSVIKEPAGTKFSKDRKTYSGKLGGKQDDCVLAIQMALYGSKTFFQEAKYNQFRTTSGVPPTSRAWHPENTG